MSRESQSVSRNPGQHLNHAGLGLRPQAFLSQPGVYSVGEERASKIDSKRGMTSEEPNSGQTHLLTREASSHYTHHHVSQSSVTKCDQRQRHLLWGVKFSPPHPQPEGSKERALRSFFLEAKDPVFLPAHLTKPHHVALGHEFSFYFCPNFTLHSDYLSLSSVPPVDQNR